MACWCFIHKWDQIWSLF